MCLTCIRYAHIRIDPVHYCELEEELSEKREKRGSFFNRRNAEPVDVPEMRLRLLMRTVRENPDLGSQVLSLRTPYMTREANKAALARTVSALPRLHFVDLPNGVFNDDPSCYVLKQELMARCPDIRRMSYQRGSEGTFSQIPHALLWRNLEMLELGGLQVDTRILRFALGSFLNLHDLTLEDMPRLDDSAFTSHPTIPPFPPVQNLVLRDTPNVTASGLAGFFDRPANRQNLLFLTLSSTGVLPESLHRILASAPRLIELSYMQEISRSFPVEPVAPLASKSLTLLHYEITSAMDNAAANYSSTLPSRLSTAFDTTQITRPYYSYLTTSLVSNSLPALVDLFVRDSDFAESLLLPPPPPRGGLLGANNVNNPFAMLTQPLNVYSKGLDELEWNFTPYEPPSARPGNRDSTTRPISVRSAHLSSPWGGDARKSVLVGNGFGGFLAVPTSEGRPKSSSSMKRESRADLWR